jgi:NAD(P)-dependent dehydrogenase (short-subunit alcohol dehydrogenase family)
MDLHLTGKLALVTGSTAGIGLAIARALANEGARVILNGRTDARVAEAARQVPGAERFPGDLSDAAVADRLIARFPNLDILVNNLGVYGPKPFEEITDADWRSIIEINFMSGVRLCRHYLPAMLRAGQGRIIFISSESAVFIPSEMIHYGVTKTMQIALARGLAQATAGTGVTVNSVLAGPTLSEGVGTFLDDLAHSRGLSAAEMQKEFFRNARPTSLLKRFETPDEIAAMVAFVASPLSSATNGAALRAEGGIVQSIL